MNRDLRLYDQEYSSVAFVQICNVDILEALNIVEVLNLTCTNKSEGVIFLAVYIYLKCTH